MGDKDQARATMAAAGVPIVPGTDIINDPDGGHRRSGEIGYPLLVKARSGSGGKGIRLVERSEGIFSTNMPWPVRAQNAFSDDGVYLESF